MNAARELAPVQAAPQTQRRRQPRSEPQGRAAVARPAVVQATVAARPTKQVQPSIRQVTKAKPAVQAAAHSVAIAPPAQAKAKPAKRKPVQANVTLLMPPPPDGLSVADKKRLHKVNTAAGVAAQQQQNLPDAPSNVAAGRAAVQEPPQETQARAQSALIDELGQRPAPSAAITNLCQEIRRAIREKRPPDEASLLRSKPADQAKQAGGQIQSSVKSSSDNTRAGYQKLNQPAQGIPTQNGQAPALPAAQVKSPALNASQAVPDAVPAEKVSLDADVNANAASISQAGMNSPTASLVQDGPIAEARAAQSELQQMAKRDPAQVLAEQQAAQQRASAEMASLEQQALQALQAGRATTVGDLGKGRGSVKLSEEQQRTQASTKAKGLFEAARSRVEALLKPLSDNVMAMWDSGLARLTTKFENKLEQVEQWKRKRYAESGNLLEKAGGSLVRLWDDTFGLPSWVITHYNQAEKAFGDGVCTLLTNISVRINGVIASCETLIAQAGQQIGKVFSSLPQNLQAWAQQQQAQFSAKLAGLSQQVKQSRKQLNNKLSKQARGAVQQVRERIHKLREAAGGLVGRIKAAIKQFLADPVSFIINGLLKLAGIVPGAFWSLIDKIKAVIGYIANKPVEFAGRLAGVIGDGFRRFFDNFPTHMFSGFFSWLFSGLGNVGVQIPKDFSVRSLITFFLELMGITWQRVRALLVKLVGARNVALVESAVGLLGDIIKLGPAGLFEMIKEKFKPQDMIKEVIQAGVQFLVETLIKQVSARLLLMFNPAGAIVQAIELIYRILDWVFSNAARLFGFVETVVSGAVSLIKGNTGGMILAIEGALARLIAPVIDFLAGFLGLGKLPEKIADTIRGFQQRLWKIIEKVLGGLIKRARGMLGKAGAKISNWWKKRVSFRSTKGEKHQLYFHGQERSAKLMVASKPQGFTTWLKGQADGDDKTKASKLFKELSAEQKKATPNDAEITRLSNELAQVSARLMGGNATPPQYGALVNSFGSSAEVETLTKDMPSGQSPSVTSKLWDILNTREKGDGNYYIRGHLLNDHLGGPGHTWANLTPITGSTNTTMSSRFEEKVKTAVKAGAHVYYQVKAVYPRNTSKNKKLLDEISAMDQGGPMPRPLVMKKALLEAEQKIPEKIEYKAHKVGGTGKLTKLDDDITNSVDENSLDDYNNIKGIDYDAKAAFNSLSSKAKDSSDKTGWSEFNAAHATAINYLDKQRSGSRKALKAMVQGRKFYQDEMEKIQNIDQVQTWAAFRQSRAAYRSGTNATLNASQITKLKNAFEAKIKSIQSS